MKPEAQRIAIAEACGWTQIEPQFKDRPVSQSPLLGIMPQESIFGGKARAFVPNYLNDLNAMHEAEKVFGDLSDEHWSSYAAWLHEIVPNSTLPSLALTHANAAQRAEAFLRTLGLWKDDASHLNKVKSNTASPKPKT